MLSIDSSMVASSCLAPPVAIKAGKGNNEPLSETVSAGPDRAGAGAGHPPYSRYASDLY